MGRHYRDEEPVPHPQDRTPRVPAEERPGRSEASGAFRTPGRSSISAAFGIAGRAAGTSPLPGGSSGSAFFTEGAEAPGFPPEPGGAQPPTRRGEASGSYPVTGARRGETSGSYPVAERPAGTRRGETSGSYPVASGAESTLTHAPRRGEAAGPSPVASRAEATVTRAPRRGDASGSYPAVGSEVTTTHAPRRADTPGPHPAAGTEATTTHAPRRGEASGSYPAAGSQTAPHSPRGETSGADATTRSRRKGGAPGSRRAADRVETPATRGSRRGGGVPVPNPAEVTVAIPTAARSRRKGGKAAPLPESAAERTEVITRQDEIADDVAAGTPAATARTLDRTDDTGSSRAVGVAGRSTERSDTTGPHRTARDDNTGPQRTGKSEGTGSHRVLGKGDVTGSHRIVGKKAPRRRIATWPIACAVLALLIGLGIVGWNWADNELNSRAEAQAASCDGGTANMRIVVTPSAQKPLTAAAQRWNQAATVVHGQCVHVVIDARPSAQVLDALVGRANLDSIGGLPAAWLPESSYWVSELTTKKPEMIGSPAQSVANARSADYPFIGLAGPGIDDTALRAAQTFREYLEQPAQQADFTAAGIKSA